MKTITIVAGEMWHEEHSEIDHNEYEMIFRNGVEFAQRWIPFPSKEIPELNKDYLVKHNILGTEVIEIMTFRNTKEVGQVFTKIVSMGSMDGLQIYPVTHWRPIELK